MEKWTLNLQTATRCLIRLLNDEDKEKLNKRGITEINEDNIVDICKEKNIELTLLKKTLNYNQVVIDEIKELNEDLRLNLHIYSDLLDEEPLYVLDNTNNVEALKYVNDNKKNNYVYSYVLVS